MIGKALGDGEGILLGIATPFTLLGADQIAPHGESAQRHMLRPARSTKALAPQFLTGGGQHEMQEIGGDLGLWGAA